MWQRRESNTDQMYVLLEMIHCIKQEYIPQGSNKVADSTFNDNSVATLQ